MLSVSCHARHSLSFISAITADGNQSDRHDKVKLPDKSSDSINNHFLCVAVQMVRV